MFQAYVVVLWPPRQTSTEVSLPDEGHVMMQPEAYLVLHYAQSCKPSSSKIVNHAQFTSLLKMEYISNGWGILGEWTRIRRENDFKIQIIFAEKQKMAEFVESSQFFSVFCAYFGLS